MSDSTGLIVISFLAVSVSSYVLYSGRIANEYGLKICTGVVDGTTVPTVQRWHMVYNMWVPYQSGAFMGTMFVGVAELVTASLVGNENVKFLAYLVLIMAFVGSLFSALTGIVIFMNYRSVLRQAEAD
jgi:hypothetical protein